MFSISTPTRPYFVTKTYLYFSEQRDCKRVNAKSSRNVPLTARRLDNFSIPSTYQMVIEKALKKNSLNKSFDEWHHMAYQFSFSLISPEKISQHLKFFQAKPSDFNVIKSDLGFLEILE